MENVDLFPEYFEQQNITHLYCDGGVVGRNPSDFGGSWAYVAVNSKDEEVFVKSGFHQTEDRQTTNNHTELMAVIHALEAMPDGWSGTICTDSEITFGRLLLGWKMKNVPQEYIDRLNAVKKRMGKIFGERLDGHPTKAELEAGISKKGNKVSKHNVRADALCTEVVSKIKGKQ